MLLQKLRFQNYAETTIKTYIGYSKRFLSHFKQDVYHIPVKDAQHFLENYDYSSRSQQNQIISSIQFLYLNVVGSKLNTLNIKRPRKEKKLPKIIDYDLASTTISNIKNLKHKAILAIPFTSGLRVSEILNLKPSDIDSKRMLINVREGKGKKDRIVPLSEDTLQILRSYFKKYNPKEYLFVGQFGGKYSATSCNNLIKKYFNKEAHMHILRHTYLTWLADNNVALKTIQDIAGHKSSKTTEVYIHLSINTLKSVPSPKIIII